MATGNGKKHVKHRFYHHKVDIDPAICNRFAGNLRNYCADLLEFLFVNKSYFRGYSYLCFMSIGQKEPE